MPFLGLRKWPTPFLRPTWPFLAAGVITLGLVAKIQDLGVHSEQYAKDPKNPYIAQIAKHSEHH